MWKSNVIVYYVLVTCGTRMGVDTVVDISCFINIHRYEEPILILKLRSMLMRYPLMLTSVTVDWQT